MIKRTIHIILASLILISTSGIFLSIHFCHGQRSKFSINKDAGNCCDTACKHCKTINKYIKINDVFKISQETIQVYEYNQDVVFTSLICSICSNTIFTKQFYYSTSAPPSKHLAIYTLVENYRL